MTDPTEVAKIAVSEKTKRWVKDNLLAAKRLMPVSAKAGNGQANFAAYDAAEALKELADAIERGEHLERKP